MISKRNAAKMASGLRRALETGRDRNLKVEFGSKMSIFVPLMRPLGLASGSVRRDHDWTATESCRVDVDIAARMWRKQKVE
jgi:hypothetical protein